MWTDERIRGGLSRGFAARNIRIGVNGRLGTPLLFILVIAERFESRILQWRGFRRPVVDPRAFIDVAL
jgi:hypothetical protein